MSARGAPRNVTGPRVATSLGVVVGIAIAVATFASAGGGILAHVTCDTGPSLAHQTDAWIPAVLVNSPFGGNASGTGIMNWNFPGAWNGPPPAPGHVFKLGWGTGALNGTTSGAFFAVNISVFVPKNTTLIGPGENHPCNSAIELELQAPSTYGGSASSIQTVSNFTNAGEAVNATLFPGLNGSVQSPAFFSNGFYDANRPSVTTCSAAGETLPLTTQGLGVTFHIEANNSTYQIAYELPFTEEFSYTFPADFGTWQVDNLSAPGGPGGGWAFNFLGACT